MWAFLQSESKPKRLLFAKQHCYLFTRWQFADAHPLQPGSDALFKAEKKFVVWAQWLSASGADSGPWHLLWCLAVGMELCVCGLFLVLPLPPGRAGVLLPCLRCALGCTEVFGLFCPSQWPLG